MRSNNGVKMTIDKSFIRKLCMSLLTFCSSFNVDLQLNISPRAIHWFRTVLNGICLLAKFL